MDQGLRNHLNVRNIVAQTRRLIARERCYVRARRPAVTCAARADMRQIPMKVKPDHTDWLILQELQGDGRMTNVELARRVGISAPPCLRRVRTLEETGIIRGYHADLDGGKLGFQLTAFAMVGLHSQAEADLIAFEERVNGWPLVRECYMLSGEIDFVLKCQAPDLEAFQAFIIRDLTAAPNVDSVKTSLAIRRSKHVVGVPLEVLGETD